MPKTVAVINDLSSLGNCSLTAAIAVLASMGHRPCPLPTAVLSAQSEFPVFCGRDLTELMPRYAEAWSATRERFDGICTGYFASGAQITHALEFLDRFRRESTLLLVDPVMGDNGVLYPAFDRTACARMKELAARADVLTPNLTELYLLAGEDYRALTDKQRTCDDLERTVALAAPLSRGRGVIVTGVMSGDDVCNIAVQDGDAEVIRSPKTGGHFSGTGDLFAAVVCGSLLRGKTTGEAARAAAAFVQHALEDTVSQPHDPLYGINYEKFLNTLAGDD